MIFTRQGRLQSSAEFLFTVLRRTPINARDLGAPVPLGGKVLPIGEVEGSAAQEADNFRPVVHECERELCFGVLSLTTDYFKKRKCSKTQRQAGRLKFPRFFRVGQKSPCGPQCVMGDHE